MKKNLENYSLSVSKKQNSNPKIYSLDFHVHIFRMKKENLAKCKGRYVNFSFNEAKHITME
jgi:hypothetical protein